MIIEFPKKYNVIGADRMFTVTVPDEYADSLLSMIKRQPWIKASWFVLPDDKAIICIISSAYDVTDEQAHDALCRLCEHVMSAGRGRPSGVGRCVGG